MVNKQLVNLNLLLGGTDFTFFMVRHGASLSDSELWESRVFLRNQSHRQMGRGMDCTGHPDR